MKRICEYLRASAHPHGAITGAEREDPPGYLPHEQQEKASRRDNWRRDLIHYHLDENDRASRHRLSLDVSSGISRSAPRLAP